MRMLDGPNLENRTSDYYQTENDVKNIAKGVD